MTITYVLGHGHAYEYMTTCPLPNKQYKQKITDSKVVFVDMNPDVNPDEQFDVTQVWPVESASIDLINDTIGTAQSTYFTNTTFLNELNRVLIKGGEYIGYTACDKGVQLIPELQKRFTSVTTFQNVPFGTIGLKLIQ